MRTMTDVERRARVGYLSRRWMWPVLLLGFGVWSVITICADIYHWLS